MKTLHWYLLRQVIATLLVAVSVLAGVLLLGSVIKEMVGVMLSQNAGLRDVARAIGILIPFLLVFALPVGMLTATLLVFGRLSADQELTAMRASGLSLVSLVSPVLWFSAVMCVVCAVVNLEYAPRARQAFKRLLFEFGERNLGSIIPSGSFQDFPLSGGTNTVDSFTIYVGTIAGWELGDVSIYGMKERRAVQVFRASRATLQFDSDARTISITLFDGHFMDFDHELPSYFEETSLPPIELGDPSGQRGTPLSDRTIAELLKERERRLEMDVDVTPVTFYIHAKIASCFACIGFTLVGIPLGLQTHRRETRIGLLVALVLVGLYYGFFLVGEGWSSRPAMHPHLLVWVPNFLFQAVGAVLLYRADHQVR